MAKREYGQYCAAARALDLVGDRWTLLLVRELLIGPKRYTDLQNGLPGIGTNLLADRLKELESEGIVRRRTLPVPAASTVYELTERGRGLEPVLVELARWGVELLGEYGSDQAWRPEWSILAMRATFRPEAARGVRETYQFRIGDEVFYATVQDGAVETGQGRARDRAVAVETDVETFLSVASGRLPLGEAIESGRYRVEGDLEALRRCGEIFALQTAG